jgi:peptidoglycan/LPS O-acetylase OafA/YrhL
LTHKPGLLAGPAVPGAAPLALLGRWSLSFYMLHQPVFIGLILLGRGLRWW